VSHRVEEKCILEQDWATFTNGLCCCDCFHRTSETCCGSNRILVKK
jgi:hypothetical protein